MKAVESDLNGLLEGKKQYQVPLYQRTYSWRQAQFKQLWDDIVQLADEREQKPGATHFMGSVVLAPSPLNGPVGLTAWLVVDGQQRLTTLTLLLAAIRDHRAENENPDHRDRVNDDYLINKWAPGKPSKLMPTQADRDSYEACIRSTALAGGADAVGTAYAYFRSRLLDFDDPEDALDIERIEDAVVRGLAMVAISAEPGDNVHRIFESLNNTGLRLTQGDLLRNYLFMRLPTRGEEVYQLIWLPLQESLTAEELELLFWIDLVQDNDTIPQSETYAGQQARLDRIHDEEGIVEEMERFAQLGQWLQRALRPELEDDPQVRFRLNRLREWGTSTALPITVHLLERRAKGEATSDEIANALLYLESFFVRRIVIGKATNNLNRILLAAVPAIKDKTPVDAALRTYLSTGRKFWATDDQIRDAASTVAFYWQGRARQKNLILQWIEADYASKEPVDPANLTIEHIAPQTTTPEWIEEFARELPPGEDVNSIYQRLLHTLGNVTLTGYNTELSNSSWPVKKTWYANSALRITKEIAENEHWGPSEIQERARQLAHKIVTIWPGPDLNATDVQDNPLWGRLAQVLAQIPAGAWTSYGDVAALIGTHQVPLGNRLSTVPTLNAHRVLRVDGTVSPEFRWTDPQRTDDPKAVLTEEGIQFDDAGKANQAQRLTLDDLAHLAGADAEDIVGPLRTPEGGNDETRRDRFLEQVTAHLSPSAQHGLLKLLDAWTAAGGTLVYGDGADTSCFLMARTRDDHQGSIWPAAIYPSGKLEIVFQHMTQRPPFDDVSMREQFRTRLNDAGADIPAAKIDLRPGIPLDLVADEAIRQGIEAALLWFLQQSRSTETEPSFT
jgi:alkylated DNA nucleotide flippase Atl1